MFCTSDTIHELTTLFGSSFSTAVSLQFRITVDTVDNAYLVNFGSLEKTEYMHFISFSTSDMISIDHTRQICCWEWCPLCSRQSVIILYVLLLKCNMRAKMVHRALKALLISVMIYIFLIINIHMFKKNRWYYILSFDVPTSPWRS